MAAHPLYSALSQQELSDPIKPAYNQSGRLLAQINSQRLKPTMDQCASCWQSWSQTHSTYYYTELAASFTNFLYYCSSSSGFYGAEKDNRSRHTDSPPGRHSIRSTGALTPSSPIFTPNALPAASLQIYPGVGQALNNADLHIFQITSTI